MPRSPAQKDKPTRQRGPRRQRGARRPAKLSVQSNPCNLAVQVEAEAAAEAEAEAEASEPRSVALDAPVLDGPPAPVVPSLPRTPSNTSSRERARRGQALWLASLPPVLPTVGAGMASLPAVGAMPLPTVGPAVLPTVGANVEAVDVEAAEAEVEEVPTVGAGAASVAGSLEGELAQPAAVVGEVEAVDEAEAETEKAEAEVAEAEMAVAEAEPEALDVAAEEAEVPSDDTAAAPLLPLTTPQVNEGCAWPAVWCSLQAAQQAAEELRGVAEAAEELRGSVEERQGAAVGVQMPQHCQQMPPPVRLHANPNPNP